MADKSKPTLKKIAWIFKGFKKNGEPYTRYRVCHKVSGETSFIDSSARLIKPFKCSGGQSVFVTDFGSTLKVNKFYFTKGGLGYNTSMFSLSAKNGRLTAYSISNGRVLNQSVKIFNTINRFFTKKEQDKKLKYVLNIFFKNNNIYFNKAKSGVDNLKNALFPMNEIFNFNCIDNSVSRDLLIPKFEEFCKKITGCKGNATKKMLAKASINRLKFLKLFKGLMPIDSINGKLSNCVILNSFPRDIDISKIRRFLKLFSSKRLEIMTSKVVNLRASIISDTVRFWTDFGRQITIPAQPDSFESLHDEIHRQILSKSKDNTPLKINSNLRKINNSIFEFSGTEYKAVIPADSFELATAGKSLNNCLGGYSKSVNEERVSIILFLKNNVLFSAMSLNKMPTGRFNVEQFVCDRNSRPADIDRDAILGFLKKNEIIY